MYGGTEVDRALCALTAMLYWMRCQTLIARSGVKTSALFMLQCCVCLSLSSSSVTLCIIAKRCVLEQKLLLTAYRKSYYEKSIGTKMNDLDLCLESFKVTQPLCVTFAIESRKPLEIGLELWFQWTINRTRKLCYRKDYRAMRAI